MTTFKSAYEEIDGMVYIPRMLEKIRMYARNELPEDYISFLGNGFDKIVSTFLQIEYVELKAFVLEGKSDDEAMAWIRENGREMDDDLKRVYNEFMTKKGWRDLSPYENTFIEYKERYGFGDRDDIETFFDFFEVDEGRKP